MKARKMKKNESKKQTNPAIINKFLINLCLAVLLVYVAKILTVQQKIIGRSKREIGEYNRLSAIEKFEQESLANEFAILKTPEYIEKTARDRFHFIKNNERIYKPSIKRRRANNSAKN